MKPESMTKVTRTEFTVEKMSDGALMGWEVEHDCQVKSCFRNGKWEKELLSSVSVKIICFSSPQGVFVLQSCDFVTAKTLSTIEAVSMEKGFQGERSSWNQFIGHSFMTWLIKMDVIFYPHLIKSFSLSFLNLVC